jgi:hypothetical protein
MGQIAEIESRFNALAGGLQSLGIDLAPSLENVGRAPQATCVNNGIVIEFLLRDLWKRLAIKGSARQKSIEELLTQVLRVLEESEVPMPRRVLDKIRGGQTKRNRAAHHAPDEITEEDAIKSLQQLADVANWYFGRYVPEATASAPLPPARQASPPASPALTPLRIAILYKRKRQPDEVVLNWSRPVVPRPTLEQEGGAVPLESHFYIVRPVDNASYQANRPARQHPAAERRAANGQDITPQPRTRAGPRIRFSCGRDRFPETQ